MSATEPVLQDGARGLLALIDVPPEPLSALRRRGFAVRLATSESDRQAAASEGSAAIRAVVTSGLRGFRAAEVAAFPNLEIICTLGSGYENVDIAAARRRGIALTHGPGTNASSVADHAMALLLSVVRGIPAADAAVRRGGWDALRTPRPSLADKRMGVLGLGAIGSAVSERASGGFGMEVGYHNRREMPGCGYRYFDALPDLAAWADFLIVTCRAGPSTLHLVDAGVLAKLGASGYLVNVARGSVVDTAALIEALRDGTIAGAALDVVEGEPVVPPALLDLPNAVLTPHIASRSPEAVAAAWGLVLRNLDAHFAGQPVVTPIPHDG